jgi:F-type H+-transporting ATPase subunit delta
MSLLAKRYASALHLAAKASNAVAQVETDLRELHGDLQDRSVQMLLTSPDVKAAQRAVYVDKLGSGRHALVQNFLRVALQRRRQEMLPDLFPAFRALCMEERGEVEGVVETPKALGPDDLARLAELAKSLCGKTCVLTQRERPELIGGVRLIVGDVLYDGSVLSSLQQLEQKLLQASI